MKNTLIIFAILLASCTKDNNCQKVKEIGFNAQIGTYIVLQDDSKVPVNDYRTYKVGDEYCK